MIAREIFKKLGYELVPNFVHMNEKVLAYSNYEKYITIEFYLDKKEFRKRRTDFSSFSMNSSMLELHAINKQCEELGWLEEEKTEINIEHYFDDLTKFGVNGFAVVNGEVTSCAYTDCSECIFNRECDGKNRLKWLASKHKKLVYKLNQFEFDIIQTYRDCHESCKFSEFKQLIELKDKGYFQCVDDNIKIQDVLKNCEVIKQ